LSRSDATVTMEMTLAHAEAVASLLDLASRLHMGQVSEIAALVSTGSLLMRDEGVPAGRRDATPDEIANLEDVLKTVQRAIGQPHGASFGIAASSEEARRGYEVMKVVRKAIHQHLRPEIRHVVDADGLTVRYVKDAAPTATIAEAAGA
jgi:hypothetical protein